MRAQSNPGARPHRSDSANLFVTGTDTGVGKTVASCALLQALQDRGLRAIGMKPIASGSEVTPAGLRNEDALALQRLSKGVSYELINPCAYEPPIAPHLAARAAGRPISMDDIEVSYRQLADLADIVVVEGAGGWRVPLDDDLGMAEIPRRLGLGVVLVVGIRLGCLSHAILTAEAIRADGLELRGWIASCIEPPDHNDDAQIETLQGRLGAPLLGVLPHRPGVAPETLAAHLDPTAALRTG